MTNQQQLIARDRNQDESPLPPIPFPREHAHHTKWILLPIHLQNAIHSSRNSADASPGNIWCRDHRGTLLASFFFFVSQPGTLVVHATSAIHSASHSGQYGAQLHEHLLHPSTHKYTVIAGDIYLRITEEVFRVGMRFHTYLTARRTGRRRFLRFCRVDWLVLPLSVSPNS